MVARECRMAFYVILLHFQNLLEGQIFSELIFGTAISSWPSGKKHYYCYEVGTPRCWKTLSKWLCHERQAETRYARWKNGYCNFCKIIEFLWSRKTTPLLNPILAIFWANEKKMLFFGPIFFLNFTRFWIQWCKIKEFIFCVQIQIITSIWD